MSWIRDLFNEIKKLFTWWGFVLPWESGIRVQFGKKIKRLEPGFYWSIPIMHKTFIQSIRKRVCDLPIQTLTTKDGKTLTVKGMLGYDIRNVELLYTKLHHAQDTIVNIAAGEIAEYIATRDSGFTPADVEKGALKEISFRGYGLGGLSLRLTDFAYVRTYRIITSDPGAMWGDALATNVATNGGLNV